MLGYLKKEVEKYGLISVTPQGEEFYKNPVSVLLTEDREFIDTDDDDSIVVGSAKTHAGSGGGGDQTLLAMLKDVRASLSKKLKLPAFVIFGDPSLEDMSIMYPITLEELKNCQGVGEGKAKKFGKEFIQLIAKYVEENNIDRPTDFVVKTVANKSLNKIHIIQSIDRKLPFEDIAKARDLEMDQLLDELEAIVHAGTRINIDYYIKQVVDEDKIDDIYDYFKEEATSDSVTDAMKALGKDYSEEEVRLIRIKFLSELGN